MSDRVRLVRTKSVGLDLALGGGVRLVKRIPKAEQESAALLVRGGPGTGKSVMAQDIALRIAKEIGGDVLYVCIEILPAEVIAQRMGFADFDPRYAIDLAVKGRAVPDPERPHLVVGRLNMEIEGDEVPDLGETILQLNRLAMARDCSPKVVVVDSLIEGYNLGSNTPREIVDGICKISIEQGWVLILIEEVTSNTPSAWEFAVDTVLSLRVAPPVGTGMARRELTVTKHRFGPCEPGPHRVQIDPERVRVIPPLEAYRNAGRDLVLPAPAKNRSLRVPVKGPEPDWEQFRVPDHEGHSVVLLGHGSDAFGPLFLSQKVGWFRGDGTPQQARGRTIMLSFPKTNIRDRATTDLFVTTAHLLMNGPEWLEEKLRALMWTSQELSIVRIGPMDALASYEEEESLKRAVILLVDILTQAGLITVVSCSSAKAPRELSASFFDSVWTMGPEDTGPRVTVLTKRGLTFVPDLYP